MSVASRTPSRIGTMTSRSTVTVSWARARSPHLPRTGSAAAAAINRPKARRESDTASPRPVLPALGLGPALHQPVRGLLLVDDLLGGFDAGDRQALGIEQADLRQHRRLIPVD